MDLFRKRRWTVLTPNFASFISHVVKLLWFSLLPLIHNKFTKTSVDNEVSRVGKNHKAHDDQTPLFSVLLSKVSTVSI